MLTSVLRRARLLALVAVLALVAAACDGDDAVADDPREALREAFTALADYEGFELTLRLEPDDAAAAQAVEDGELDAEELELITASSLLVRTTGEGDDGAAEFVLNVGGADLVEVRLLPDLQIFARADLQGLVDLSDETDAGEALEEFVASAEMFGFGDVAAAVEAGEWIHLTGVQQLMNLFEGMGGVEEPDVDEEEAERLAEELAAAGERFLEQDVEVEYVGSEDAGERVRATADGAALQRLLDDIAEVVAGADLLGGVDVPGELREEVPPDLTLSVDAWISDGRLSQVAVDLAAVGDEDLGGEVLLVLGLAEFTGSIDAPDGATQIDLFGLVGGFLGGMMPDEGELFDDELHFEDDATPDDEIVDDDPFEGELPPDDLFDAECITPEELDEVEELLGPEVREEMDQLIEAGLLEVC